MRDISGQVSSDVAASRSDRLNSILLYGVLPTLIGLLIIVTYGDILLTVGILLFCAVVAVTLYRIEWGFFIFIGLVLVLDQYPIPGFESITLTVPFFQNLKEIGPLQSVSFAVLNPVELFLLFLAIVWLVLLATRKNTMLSHIALWPIALLFLFAIGLSFAYGIWTGGDFLVALWEVRALFYFLILYFFTPQILQTRRHVEAFVWVVIAAVTVKALQGCARFVSLGFTFAGLPTLTNHEDPVFIGTLFILLIAMSVFGAKHPQLRVLRWLLLVLIFGFVAGQRRAAYGAFFATLIGFIILAPKKELARYVKYIIPAIILLTIYAAVFWNSEGRFASPIRLLKTAFAEQEEQAADRYYSNLYREYERYDLAQTVKRSPIKGIGFGNMYDQPIWLESMPMPFTLRNYIPHNEFLWLLVKMGTGGFTVFCLFFTSYAFYGASVFARLKDPYLKSVCAVALLVGTAQIFVSYFDLQLTYYRNMIYFGTLMGLLPTLQTLDSAQTKEAVAA